MKKYVEYILLMMCMLVLISCVKNKPDKIVFENPIRFQLDDFSIKRNKDLWSIESVEMENISNENIDYDISSSCISKEKLYYVISGYSKMSNNCIEYNIFSKDIKLGKSELLFSNDSNELRQVSVMKILKNSLFWIEENNNNWRFMKFDLNSNEIIQLSSSENNEGVLPPNLEVGKDTVYWYEISDNYIELITYDINNDKIEKYSNKDYYVETPYDVISFQDNHLTYLVKENENISICVDDLVTQDKKIISTNNKTIVKAVSNDEYIIWIDDWYDSNLYIYDIKSKGMNEINCKDANIRSIALYNEIILIDFSKLEFKIDDYMYNNTSAVMQLDMNSLSLYPVFIPETNFTSAWLQHHDNNVFSINMWGNNKVDFQMSRVIIT